VRRIDLDPGAVSRLPGQVERERALVLGGSDRRVFSLSAEREAEARTERLGRAVGLVLGIGFVAAGWLVGMGPGPPLGRGDLGTGVMVLLIAIGCLSIGGALLRGPGPTEIVVSTSGIERQDANGRRSPMIEWTYPHLRLVLVDRRVPTVLGRVDTRRRGSGLRWLAPGRSSFDLSAEAYDGILDAARAAGLSIERRGGGGRPTITTIRPADPRTAV
jgi:hypothetical protein